MNDSHIIKIAVTSIATITAIIFIIASHLYPEISVLLLSIELILLPSIYIIGGEVSERIIKNEYQIIVDRFQSEFNKLKEKIYIDKRTGYDKKEK